jgi:hypothetical protein
MKWYCLTTIFSGFDLSCWSFCLGYEWIIHTVIFGGAYVHSVKTVLRGHTWDNEEVVLQDRWPLKRGSIHMDFSMTGQEICDLLIQVTA